MNRLAATKGTAHRYRWRTVKLTSFYPQVGTVLTATLSDPDGVTLPVDWSWANSSNRDSDTWTDIDGADANTYTPVADDVGDYLRVTASYTDAESPSKSAHAVSSDAVQEAAGIRGPAVRRLPAPLPRRPPRASTLGSR